MPFLNSVIQPLANLGHFWQEKINGRVFRWNLFLICLQIGILSWKFTLLPPQVPLYYSLPWGDSQLANNSSLFMLPTISIVILFIDSLFSVSFFKNLPLLSRLSVTTSLLVSFLITITLFKIIFLIS
ncbi:MAG: hypothetical protein KIH89_001900 [Candidatus Shapirobacteria bacterium]|nr:hypothetical protein [Candidatus Shapirobacteria bacterium]